MQPCLSHSLEAYHVAEHGAAMRAILGGITAEQLPTRRFLESYAAAGAPACAPSPPWKWYGAAAREFFSTTLHTLPAGSVVLLDSEAGLRADARDPTLRDNRILYDESTDWLLSSPRLWALLNHSEPLVVFLHSDGACNIPWPRDTHHLLYRDVWCADYESELRASQAAEATAGPSAAWLRSVPFGTNVDLPVLAGVGEDAPPAASERPLLFSFRGALTRSKPSRERLVRAERAVAGRLAALAETIVGGRPLHASGVGRYLIDTKGEGTPIPLEAPYATAGNISYVELLRSSIFSVSPPGDLWESYRTYEAIEAGSIPVVAVNATYHGCAAPAAHMLATIPGVVGVASWEELPEALATAAVNVSDRQQAMLEWNANEKRSFHDGLHDAVARMRRGAWRARVPCRNVPLSPVTVAAQRAALARYWRRPQPFVVSVWDRPGGFLDESEARPFLGAGGFCQAESGAFEEKCLAAACNPPLIKDLVCGPT